MANVAVDAAGEHDPAADLEAGPHLGSGRCLLAHRANSHEVEERDEDRDERKCLQHADEAPEAGTRPRLPIDDDMRLAKTSE